MKEHIIFLEKQIEERNEIINRLFSLIDEYKAESDKTGKLLEEIMRDYTQEKKI